MMALDIVFILLFAYIGGSLKYIDSVYDDGVFNRKFALILSVLTGFVFCLVIALNEYAAGIYLGIVISVILAGKIDELAFSLCTAIIFAGVILLGTESLLHVNILTLVVIVTASFIDEIGNDSADALQASMNINNHPEIKCILINLYMQWFKFRCTVFAGLIFLILFENMPWVFFIAVLADEGMYQFVGSIAEKRKEIVGQNSVILVD